MFWHYSHYAQPLQPPMQDQPARLGTGGDQSQGTRNKDHDAWSRDQGDDRAGPGVGRVVQGAAGQTGRRADEQEGQRGGNETNSILYIIDCLHSCR